MKRMMVLGIVIAMLVVGAGLILNQPAAAGGGPGLQPEMRQCTLQEFGVLYDRVYVACPPDADGVTTYAVSTSDGRSYEYAAQLRTIVETDQRVVTLWYDTEKDGKTFNCPRESCRVLLGVVVAAQ